MGEKGQTKMLDSDVFGAPPGSGSSQNYMEPKKTSHRTASTSFLSHNSRFIFWLIKFVLVVGTVAVLLAIPIIIYHDVETFPDDATDADFKARLGHLWLYNIFMFFLVSWLGIAFFYILGTALPYIFRFVARYVNPAHARYWRIIRVMRKPLCYVGGTFVAYLAFSLVGPQLDIPESLQHTDDHHAVHQLQRLHHHR